MEPVQVERGENEEAEVKDEDVLRVGERLGECFLVRHQFQMVALALRMDGEHELLKRAGKRGKVRWG